MFTRRRIHLALSGEKKIIVPIEIDSFLSHKVVMHQYEKNPLMSIAIAIQKFIILYTVYHKVKYFFFSYFFLVIVIAPTTAINNTTMVNHDKIRKHTETSMHQSSQKGKWE
jgi:hypothetical protein